MSNNNENWIETYTGKQFHYLQPSLAEVDIRDIAHHLSLLCRFTGASRVFYSVGQHSIHVAECLPRELKLAGLLHDAAEAFLNDIATPVKEAHGLDKTEAGVRNVIERRFGLDLTPAQRVIISYWDKVLLATEVRDFMTGMPGWSPLPPSLEEVIYPWEPTDVEASFLDYFIVYGGTSR